VGGTQLTAEREATPNKDTRGRFRLASPTTAVVLGVLGIVLTILHLPVAQSAHHAGSGAGLGIFGLLALGLPGIVIARRQPANPIGWILIGIGVGLAFYVDVETYSILDYHFHHGDLPVGPAAVLVASNLWVGLFLALPLVILLFPDGRLPGRWRMVLWAYLAVAMLLVACIVGSTAWNLHAQAITVDNTGHLINNPNPTGAIGKAITICATFALIALPLFWLSFVVRQVVSWRQSSGERRQQLKWLMCGGALTIIGLVGLFLSGQYSGAASTVLNALGFGMLALPISLSVGILKYRLYDIDRIISRTLSYAAVTGIVVGVYVGVVTVVTRVLGFSSPVAVAASTLAAVALFNPLRVRVQRVVDRRFNRARYDAEATIATFTARLRDAVDIETVRAELLEVVNHAVEPAHASVWIRRKSIP
jgi:hypothetical protein